LNLLVIAANDHQTAGMGRRSQIVAFVVLITCGGFIAWLSTGLVTRPGSNSVLFGGKSLDTWFYGSRNDFFSERVRDSAQEALNAVGTNAFPFLLAKLKAGQGTPAPYNRAYANMPHWLKAHLPYPLYSDDIRMVCLGHLWKMHNRLSRHQLHAVADFLPKCQNPRLRMQFLLFLSDYQVDEGFLRMYRELLDDTEPAIRLEAAIPVAESAIRTDPKEPRLAGILLPAFERKDIRDQWADLSWYGYEQYPPGGSRRPPTIWPPGVASELLPNEDKTLRNRIKTALVRLRPYLTPEQDSTLNKLIATTQPSSPPL
jgi:hypothetical protein